MTPDLLAAVRERFAHVKTCPFEGPRVFFDNACGALRLKSVIETNAAHAGFPDNQGRANPASKALMDMIARGKSDCLALGSGPLIWGFSNKVSGTGGRMLSA